MNKVLLVDEDDQFRDKVKTHLERTLVVELIEASTPSQALSLLPDDYRVVISALQFSRDSGLDIYQAIIRNDQSLATFIILEDPNLMTEAEKSEMIVIRRDDINQLAETLVFIGLPAK